MKNLLFAAILMAAPAIRPVAQAQNASVQFAALRTPVLTAVVSSLQKLVPRLPTYKATNVSPAQV